MSAHSHPLTPPPPRLCACGARELTDWRPICPDCYRSAPEDDRIELAARGKRISRAAVHRLLAHAAARANNPPQV